MPLPNSKPKEPSCIILDLDKTLIQAVGQNKIVKIASIDPSGNGTYNYHLCPMRPIDRCITPEIIS